MEFGSLRQAQWRFQVLIAGGAVGAMLLAPAAVATGTTWWVANQGLDSASCGIRAKPCRSISAAIEKASAGDVIEVGAGLYGDLNGDGEFTAPGEEHYMTEPNGDACIICVDKAIKILSLHGADDTIIDAGNSRRTDPNSPVGRVDNVVSITSSGVTLGTDGGGFTITGSARNGVHVEPPASSGMIIGNTAQGNPTAGFSLQIVSARESAPAGNFTLRDNFSLHNAVGFDVDRGETLGAGETAYLSGNTAAENRDFGFSLLGTNFHTQMIGNVASHNGAGILLGGMDFQIRGNSLIGNIGPGILVGGISFPTTLARITDNTIVGNTGPGIYLVEGVTDIVIKNNNIYGNMSAPSTDGRAANAVNCGILNIDLPGPLDATNNYWGSATGPGSDPADNAGKGCDFENGKTIVKPFATTLFAIRP